MTSTLHQRPAAVDPTVSGRRRRVLGELDTPADVFAHLTPNWFAAVMGTGIVANAAATLPAGGPLLHAFATVVWVLAATLLVALVGGFVAHWVRHPQNARRYANHPVMGQFYGTPPMALLTVGSGTVLLGSDVIGAGPALAVDAVLWTVGTVLGVATAIWLPYRMITAPDHATAVPLPAWLMPVVPPMVSASAGALLLPHVPPGQLRLTMLVACYGLFGLSLVIGFLTMALVHGRLVTGGAPTGAAAPTVWITLGLIGQSATAANLLGADAAHAGLPAGIADGLRVFGIVFGLIMAGFGALMFALATALTVRAARQGLPFALTWWSFTFPVGTCVTGATALSVALGFTAIADLAVLLYAVLVTAWAVVAIRTARGAFSGRLFRAV